MPTYEYRCRTCDTAFELRRPMAEANAPTSCPDGHTEVVRLLSSFAAVGRASASSSSASMADAAPARGCGGACACHPG